MAEKVDYLQDSWQSAKGESQCTVGVMYIEIYNIYICVYIMYMCVYI